MRRLASTRTWIVATFCCASFCLSPACVGQPVAEQPKFEVGDGWTFLSTNSTGGKPIRWSLTVVELLPDNRIRGVLGNGNSWIYDGALNYMPDGMIERTIMYARYPMRVGDEWEVSSKSENPRESTTGTSKVISYERLTVPAGTFDCFVVETNWQYRQKLFNYSQRSKVWYCPAIKWSAKKVVETRRNNPYGPDAGEVSGTTVQTHELIAFTSANRSATMPLPPDLNIVEPPDSLSPNVKALSGKWIGTWSTTIKHVFVVERINSSSRATVVYCSERTPAFNTDNPFCVRREATISEGSLSFTMVNGAANVTYSLSPDGKLSGRYVNGSFVQVIEMTRFE